MATDFSYNDKTINSIGPIKPSGINQPLDPRTEVKLYADIKSIPSPYIGMIITVLQDETNSGKMTDYKVLSLKANNLGVANSVVDQVQRYVDYLGANGQVVDTNNFATKEELGLKADKTELHSHINKTVLDGITSTNVDNWNNKVDKVEGKTLTTNDYTNEEKQTVASLKATVGDTSSGLVKDVKDLKTNGVSQDNINVAIENYLTEHPVQSGATAEQAAQIQANKTAIGDNNSGLIKEVNNIKNTELQNLNTAIQTLETLVGVDETVGDKSGLPAGDANVIASINRIDSKPSGTVTNEQISTAVNNYLTEHPITGGVTSEQAQNIAQVPTLKSYVDAITIIKDDGKAIKSYEPLAINTLAETGYTNNYNFQANKANVNGWCYMVFMYDLTSVLNTSPNEVFKIKFNMPRFGVIEKSDLQCNLNTSYPIGQTTYGDRFNIENDTELVCNITTRNIGMKYALFQIGFRADNITDIYGTVSFDYYVNNEVRELFFAGAYASPESLTMNNSDVGIMFISKITTIKDKDFEIPFEIKNIDMTSVEVKLVVDGVEEIVSISKVSETSYSIPYNFNTIGTKICSIKITSGTTEYSSNNFNIVVKDSSSVSVHDIFINPDKILINGNALSIAISDLENLIKSYSSSLYGKNICFIGDSIIELDLFCTQLVNKTGCKIQNLGVCGSGWIANNGGNNFNKRIDLIEGTPDLIVFYGSCNDLNSGDLGKLGDLGTTYYGVVRETLEKVINKYKHTTKYAVITPLPAHHSSGNDNRGSFVDSYDTGNGSVKLTQENMSLAQREVAGALSIPCLDLYHNSNCFAIFPDGTITGDGLHYATNNIAPVRVIQRFLEGII